MPNVSPPPVGAVLSRVAHRVNFFETDAMGIVHHSNYLRFFEEARVVWLEEHDQPYTGYMEAGLNFATTKADVEYHRSARFDDILEVCVWLEWVRGASLRMDYRVIHGEEVVASGMTEHAAVNEEGRVRRIPVERRRHLATLQPTSSTS